MASISRRPNGMYRARYRDPDGKEHARHFPRKMDAQRWLDEVTASVLTGQYVHPRAGDITFKAYAEDWRTRAGHRTSTADLVERHLRNHVYPVLGDRRLKNVQPADVQGLDKALAASLAPSTAATVRKFVSAVFADAVRNRKIPTSPCTPVRAPRPARTKVVPLDTPVVTALRDAAPERMRALVITAAGTGLRQGELFGLTLDRINFLRREVVVNRQLVSVAGSMPTFGDVKTETSNRTVPLPQVVIDALSAHLARYPTEPDALVFTNSRGGPQRRSSFNDSWAATCERAGVGRVRFHELRHYYASLLIRRGANVKVVQARLGHKTAQETLDTYSHLWPDDDDRTREAVDAVLGAQDADSADSVRTGASAAG